MWNCVIHDLTAHIEDEESLRTLVLMTNGWLRTEPTGVLLRIHWIQLALGYLRQCQIVNEDLITTGGRCQGIQWNIGKRTMCHRHLRHSLCGGGKNNIGYTALQLQTVLRRNCGHLDEHSEIALLRACFRAKLSPFSLNFISKCSTTAVANRQQQD